MAKLYPPYINGTIPAFYLSEGTAKIVVPFSMNRGVTPSEVAGFALKIKTINGDVKGVVRVNDNRSIDLISNASVTFFIEEDDDIEFSVGQYYKVQLAYIDYDGRIGYYSTVGVVKCTTKPKVYIEGLTFGQTNTHNYSYVGVYSQEDGDVTEKMYSYQFILYDSDSNIIKDSGEQIHNTTSDSLPYESYEEFLISQDLDLHKSYYIQFKVTTLNKLVVSSLKYRIAQRRSISADIQADLIADRDFNNGFIQLALVDEIDPVISGTFLISRASSKTGFHWEEVKRFDLHSLPPKDWSYKDYTVEQGISYKYSLQQYNPQGVYSDRIISNTVIMDFEDMFLYDGQKQLKIRFNPKVTTFKNDILENKVDTIGSQFPFISRNGNVNYKEFNISGLISYLSDEAEIFMPTKDLGFDKFENITSTTDKVSTTDLLDYNIAAERIFKNEVLSWLTNGEIKLFKSPSEGNFIVRLMNVSMTPLDQLGRMLHTFSAIAYEVAEFTAENLAHYNLIDPRESLETQTRWVTVDLQTAVNDYLSTSGKTLLEAIGDRIELISKDAIYINFKDMMPGAHVILDEENIQIGATGAYHFETNNQNSAISSIKYVISTDNSGQLDYGYLAQAVTIFGLINDIKLLDTPIEQFIGKAYLNKARVWNSTISSYEYTTNLFDALNDVRTTVLNIVFLRAEKRPVETLYMLDAFASSEEREAFLRGEITDLSKYTFYTDMYCNSGEYDWQTEKYSNRFYWEDADPLTIYRIRFRAITGPYDNIRNYQYYVDANLNEFSMLTDVCIDGYNQSVFLYYDDMFKFIVNDETIDLTELEKYYLKNKNVSIWNIEFNEGVIMEVSCSKQIKVFNVENEYTRYPELHRARLQYLHDEKEKIDTRKIGHYDTTQIKQSYDNYILELNRALDKYREENGIIEQV